MKRSGVLKTNLRGKSRRKLRTQLVMSVKKLVRVLTRPK